jgi:ABC-type branched-subunit amino acid transport system ATPase component
MSLLKTMKLSKYFEGTHALEGVDITVEENHIHGLIGPNGSGKTTFFNVMTGVLSTTSGSIFFRNRDITNQSASTITRMGIGRTFQRALLMPMMSCVENVMHGMYCRTGADVLGTFFRLPFTRSAQETRMRNRALELLEIVGLEAVAERKGDDLVWVESQLLQIARALATEPQLLLLDEPTAGMGHEETERVDGIIRKIRDEMGITVILVAHDVNLVMGISDWVSVLNFGKKIAEGTPVQVQNDQKVHEAYLGEEEDDSENR